MGFLVPNLVCSLSLSPVTALSTQLFCRKSSALFSSLSHLERPYTPHSLRGCSPLQTPQVFSLFAFFKRFSASHCTASPIVSWQILAGLPFHKLIAPLEFWRKELSLLRRCCRSPGVMVLQVFPPYGSVCFWQWIFLNMTEVPTPEQSPEAVNGWHTPLLRNYLNGRGLNIDRRKLKAV